MSTVLISAEDFDRYQAMEDVVEAARAVIDDEFCDSLEIWNSLKQALADLDSI